MARANLSGLLAFRPGGARNFARIHPQSKFFPGLEERNRFLIHRNGGTGPWVASGPGIPVLDGESTEAAKFHSLPPGQSVSYFLKDRRHDGFHILAAQMRI